ncbi:efflux RND transporter periplasmic adaptor subunit [Desulforamulus reducens]|uniref:efflux RND transporter periplasmic adaptor subunit n=1 Tax=Desulforamulus reducens TaxID=59610 RepID=UPI001EE3B0C3|nr:efflux RND transporter periplasmic adaptor subunit [Desulforamulus reducens]
MENAGEASKFQKIKARFKGWPRWLKWLLGIIFLLGLGLLFFYNRSNNDDMVVQTTKVEMKSIEQSVMSTGKLESAEKQEFFTPVDSTLMEISVKVGDRLKKGQVLGRLDTQELGRLYQQAVAKLAGLEAQLARAKATDDQLTLEYNTASYEKAKNQLDRMTELHRGGAVAKTELEQAKVDFAKAEADYKEALMKVQQGASAKEIASLQSQVDLCKQEVSQAKERLDLATFICKEDGVVLFVGAEKGTRVLEGTRLLAVGSDSKLEVIANVNEIDAGTLKVGQPVAISCTSLPGKKFSGEVTRVAGVAVKEDSTSGNSNTIVPVTIQVEGDTLGLKPGYTVDVSIITLEAKKLLTVPFEAIITQNGEKLVYVVQGGIAKKRKIKTEKGNELYDIVISGLKEGEKIILNPSPALQDGQRVATGEANDKGK